MSVQFDLVGFLTTTTGTGTTIAVGSAIPDSGLRTMASAAIPDGTVVSYALVTGSGASLQRETGTATVASSGTQLTGRTLVSSTTDSLINLTGTSTVMLGPNRTDFNAIGNVTVTGTPTAGQVPIASSGTAAAWGTVSGGSPGGSDTQVLYNDGGASAGASGLTWNKATNTLTLSSGTQTAAGSALNLSVTANNASAVINGLSVNYTNTASAAASSAFDVLVGGSSRFRVASDGFLYGGGGFNAIRPVSVELWADGQTIMCMQRFSGLFSLRDTGGITWGSGAATTNGAGEILVVRGAPGTLDQRPSAGAVPQGYRVYGEFTNASNYRRLSQGMSAAGVAFLRPEGAGTGASGNVLHISGLPTSNPGPGILWNDAGTVKVGT